MSMGSTRRGFLQGSLGAALLSKAAGCADELETEGARTRVPDSEALERVRVSTRINGTERSFDVHPDDSALHVVREELGLTGSKLSCGHGACGACTMQIDGRPVVTCILPATSLAGRTVTTIEGIASESAMHPVQRAFAAQDALQCGFCTPGFVVEAVVFHDRWRAEHGKARPERETVADALSGHLCRCAAYDAIHRAVQGACAGEYDEETSDAPRHDAIPKLTGRARYTVDVRLEGRLEAKALVSPHAHARVTRLDWSRALKVPGVRGAVRLLGERGLVRHAGQEVMALAAVDERTATEALRLVDVEYEVHPPVLDMLEARAPGAPELFERGRDRRHAINAGEGPLLPEGWSGNVRGPLKLFSKQRGRARRAVDDARRDGRLGGGSFETSVQCHTALEPHAAVAKWESDEQLTVYLSSQAIDRMAEDIAERFSLKKDDVRVVAQNVGGAFGSKGTLTTEAIVAIELARVCGAPVRYVLDRRSELMIGGHRPESRIELFAAADDEGRLSGITSEAFSNSGVAVGHVVGPMLRILYPDVPKELIDYDVVTHGPPGKPFRGPGGPQAYFALESAVDELAAVTGRDPLALRREADPNPARQPLYAWAESLEVWSGRPEPGAERGRFRRGVGLAFGAWFSFVEPRTNVQLDLTPDGLVASTASQDMGNGTRTIIADTVARCFGLRPGEIDVRIGDSRYVPGPYSAGSRTTSSVVPACMHACSELADELVAVAERRWSLRGAVSGPKGVVHTTGVVPWSDVLREAPPITVLGRRKRDRGGYFLPPIDGLAVEKYVSSSIQIVSLVVDTRLGRVEVERMWGGYGIGKIVSPVLARSQAEGGMIQGLSYALYEERRLDPQSGVLLTGGLEDYRIAGIGDVPELVVHFQEDGYEKVRGRSVGLGELVTVAPAAAIANAVFNATRWRPRQLPIRPDRVLEGVRA